MATINVSQTQSAAPIMGVANSSRLGVRTSFLIATTQATLENVVTGSKYLIFNTDTGAVLASGTAASSTVTTPAIEYYGNQNLTIRVRKSGYLPYETQGILTNLGLSVWVSQVNDSNYGV